MSNARLAHMKKAPTYIKTKGAGLVPFVTNRPIRLEREVVTEDSVIHAYRSTVFYENLDQEKVVTTGSPMDKWSVFKIDDEESIVVAEAHESRIRLL